MSQRSSTSSNTTASSRRSAGSVRKSPTNSGQFLPSISSTTRTATKIPRQPGKNKPPPNSRFSASHQGERLTSSYSASPKSQYTSTQPIPLTHSQLVALLESVCIVQPRAQGV